MLKERIKKSRIRAAAVLYLVSAVILQAGIMGTGPVTTVPIEFNLDVSPEDTMEVNPVILDFGNILRNSDKLLTAYEYFNFKTEFANDMFVTTSFPDGVVDGEYSKFDVYQDGFTTGDSLTVYIYNVEDRVLPTGETKIPIVGEIREVGNIALGKYQKTVVMDVLTTPVDPLPALEELGE